MENNTEALSNAGYTSVNIVNYGNPPRIKSLDDITSYSQNPYKENTINAIIVWAESNPDREHIYTFKLNTDINLGIDPNVPNRNSWTKNCVRSLKNNTQIDCVIAGSYALWTLTKIIKGNNVGWKSNDVDMFLLGQEQHARHAPSAGLLDIVHTKDKTPAEVITNFDIPCCRVAFDMNYTFYVSIHALYSIFTKKIKLPAYLKDEFKFKKVLNEFQLDYPDNLTVPIIDTYHNMLITRMDGRIKKYQSRGFSFQWYDTKYILPWIKERFHYVDFSLADIPDRVDEDIEKQLKIIDLVKQLTEVDPDAYIPALEKHMDKLMLITTDKIIKIKELQGVVITLSGEHLRLIANGIVSDDDSQRKLTKKERLLANTLGML